MRAEMVGTRLREPKAVNSYAAQKAMIGPSMSVLLLTLRSSITVVWRQWRGYQGCVRIVPMTMSTKGTITIQINSSSMSRCHLGFILQPRRRP